MTGSITKSFIWGSCIFISQALQAQQIPAYHHYFLNGMIFNPAATGFSPTTNTFFMRNQRNLDFEGGNIVNALTVDGSLYDNKLGLGLSLYSDVIGASSGAGALISGSYKVKFSESSFMRFGIAGGAEDYRINYNQAIVKDPNDKELNSYYPGRKIVANASAGLLFQLKDFQFGISVPQLLGMNTELKALVNEGSSTGGGHTFERHYIGHARYDYTISDKLGLKVTPFALAKFVPDAPFYYEGGFVLDFRDFIWVNATYKANYGVTPALGVKIKKSICIGYAYDIVLNNAKSYMGINQEILVGYRFPQKDNSKEKKELEEAKKEIERLNGEVALKTEQVVKKQSEYDTLASQDARYRKESSEKFDKMETTLNDSINKLNQLLAKKPEVKPEVKPENNPVVEKTTNPVSFDESQIKKSENDYFIELDQTDSPQGLYVIFGAYSKDESANLQLDKYKKDFPEARIIFNRRNSLKYVVFKYSNQRQPIFETQNKAHQMGLSKAWILNYIK